MTLAAESYSSVADITAATRHLLDGATGYSTTSRPTLLEVEGIIDDVSALLNDAISTYGFSIPIVDASPRRSCDLWVRTKAVSIIEGAQRATGFDGESNSNRADWFWGLFEMADAWVEMRAQGWKNQGVAQGNPTSNGLAFTAMNKNGDRVDPTSNTLEQPKFRRGQWGGNSGL